jgi:adenosylcobinamide-phosphate synthase
MTMRPSIFAASYALDWLVGDPEFLPHPVRLIASGAGAAEWALRRAGSGKHFELVAGCLVAIAVPAASMALTAALLRRAYNFHPAFGVAAEIGLGSTCLATRNLLDEATQVMRALDAGDISRTRLRLARIVGRDTEALDPSEICRALIETLAESLSDGVLAPLFYLAIGGAPLAMTYKAINTLDSMIGHRDERYLYFGRAAARLDDVANWLPARISAALICVAAGGSRATSLLDARRVWLRDGARHASPNAGQVESAMAGALGVRLGGENSYGGERIISPHLGEEFAKPDSVAAHRALKLAATVSLLGFAAGWFLLRRSRNV